MVKLVVPKEIREEVRSQPARKRFQRKMRIAAILEWSLLLVWLALNPVGSEIFVLAGAAPFLGVFTFIWAWKDLKEMRDFEKALWAKYESEHQSVNRENHEPKPS